jgi:hypothetical protein
MHSSASDAPTRPAPAREQASGWLAAAIAEAHRGSAHAANREGGGADVWLSIPKD